MKMLKNENMNDYELANGKASYKSIVNWLVGDLLLCNNIAEIDLSIWDNLQFNLEDEDGEQVDIYQYFLCDLTEWEREKAKECGLLLSYSDLLDLDVLCVDHFGTGWSYVLTGVEIVESFEELNED